LQCSRSWQALDPHNTTKLIGLELSLLQSDPPNGTELREAVLIDSRLAIRAPLPHGRRFPTGDASPRFTLKRNAETRPTRWHSPCLPHHGPRWPCR
jgi:hypothetical protein